MKHLRKVSAVLLAVLMLAVILPTTGLLVPSTNAADVGVIENGNFSNDFTGWSYNEWAVSISSASVRFTKDSSVANAKALYQVVPVNTNATYTLTFKVKGGKLNCSSTPCFTYKVMGGTKADTCSTQLKAGTPSTGSSYTSNSVSITTTTYKYIEIQFISTGTGTEDSYLDDVSLTVVNAGDTGTHAKPSFVDFGNELNRPKDAASNTVTQPSFEDTTDAPWNTSSFIKSNLSVVNDPTAKDGSKVLRYSNSTTTESWHTFDLDLPTGGNYVLSAWVRSPFLSATNQGTASIGIIDPDTNMFFMSGLANWKGHTSTPFLQIRSTATDNQWHLRSVTFFVGSAGTVKIGVYGKQSQLDIDDISVHLLTNGVTYTGDQTGALSASNNTSNMYCDSANNLIADCNMTSATGENFWKHAASGWNNGFMNFNKTDARLEFNGTGASGKKVYNYVKWIPVEPGVKYTVSFDYRIMTKGTGSLKFIDNNVDFPVAFKTYSFSATTSDWTTTSFTFNSGNYNRIGIVFTDGTAKAYFDDFRFFKTSDGIATEPEEEVFPTLKVEHPDNGVSRMEMTDGKAGLAFKFTLESSGLTINTTDPYYNNPDAPDKSHRNDIDYTNGKVKVFGDNVEYKLVTAGVVMTNKAEVGQDATKFIRENVNDAKTVIDITAKKAWEAPTDVLTFIMRIVNIPESASKALIYARPYYVFDYNGREITVYGDIQFDSYEPQQDVNDGWLEWD